MYKFRSRSKPKANQVAKEYYYLNDKCLIRFSNMEIQFMKWIQEWEKRIFLGNRRILQMKGNCLYSCNVDQMNQMETFIKGYQENNSNVLGQDRFIWTVFASALIKKHKTQAHLTNNECSTKMCLLLLLWSSYYLKLSNSNQVQEVMKEVIVCTCSLKFLFSFLPGMSMTSFMSSFISEKCDENVLCDELISCIEEDFQFNTNIYQCYSTLLFHLVKNLTPLHFSLKSQNDAENLMLENKCPSSLISLLDKPIVDQRKHTLLMLAVQHRDEALVKLLLQMGASSDIKIWDPVTEDNITAEQLLVTSVNSLIASKCFYSSISHGFHPTMSDIMSKIKSVTVYALMMRRSLLCPSSIKADNVWRGESWRQELNSEIADQWGVDYRRPFPSLQQFAKISIRKHILQMDKKLLPDAILELPLPNMLKSYLNLMLD